LLNVLRKTGIQKKHPRESSHKIKKEGKKYNKKRKGPEEMSNEKRYLRGERQRRKGKVKAKTNQLVTHRVPPCANGHL